MSFLARLRRWLAVHRNLPPEAGFYELAKRAPRAPPAELGVVEGSLEGADVSDLERASVV